MQFFKGKDINLRALEPTDVDFLFVVENDESLWHLSDTNQPYSKFILEQFIKDSSKNIYESNQMRLIIDFKNKPIGMIDLFDFDIHHKRAGVGILILKEYHGKGFGKEALNLLIDYSFSFLKLHQLFANINADNVPSIQLFQSQGFQIMGTKRDWNVSNNVDHSTHFIDEYFLQLINTYEP